MSQTVRLTAPQAALLQQAQQALDRATRDRDLIVAALTAGRYRGTLAHYELAGRALTLTTTDDLPAA